jgi:hypothetical protein
MYELAEHLGQPISTVLAMTADEYYHWFTYIRLKAERQKNGNFKRSHSSRTNRRR